MFINTIIHTRKNSRRLQVIKTTRQDQGQQAAALPAPVQKVTAVQAAAPTRRRHVAIARQHIVAIHLRRVAIAHLPGVILHPQEDINMQISIFDANPDYIDNDVLKMPEYKLLRIDSSGYRYYAEEMEDGNYKFYISNTSLIAATTPTAQQLIDWMITTPNHKEYSRERAEYGTLMHAMFGWYMTEKTIDLVKLERRLRDVAFKMKISYRDYWADDHADDLLAFATFVSEHNVHPLAIEIALRSADGYAGTIDLICELDWEYKGFFGDLYKSGENKGKPKETKETRRITAIVDFKSGRKHFYEANEIQLECCRRLCQENFKLMPEKLLNFSPKEWRTAPDYNLKDQTDQVTNGKFEHLVAIAHIEKLMDVRTVNLYGGSLKYGEAPGLSHFKKIDMNEYLKMRKNENEYA